MSSVCQQLTDMRELTMWPADLEGSCQANWSWCHTIAQSILPSFESGAGPFVTTRAFSLYLDCFSDISMTYGMSFFHSILKCLPDKTVSGVAGRQRSNARQVRLEHPGPHAQPVNLGLGEFLGAPGDVSDEIRHLAEEQAQMSPTSQSSQTQQRVFLQLSE